MQRLNEGQKGVHAVTGHCQGRGLHMQRNNSIFTFNATFVLHNDRVTLNAIRDILDHA